MTRGECGEGGVVRVAGGLRRAVASGLLILQVGCMGPPRRIDDPADYLLRARPRRIEVVLGDGSRLRVEQPRLFGDTLLGWDPRAQEEVWVALHDLRGVEARQVDPVRTGLFALGVGAAVLAVGIAVSGSGTSSRADEMMEAVLVPVLPTVRR